MQPATREAAWEAYRKQARFSLVCQSIVSAEMTDAHRALADAERDPSYLNEVCYRIAIGVAARVLQTVYENDAEIADLKGQVERMLAAAQNLVALKPMPAVTFSKRDSHEIYVNVRDGTCYCRHCGQRWAKTDPEPPLPCTWPRIEP